MPNYLIFIKQMIRNKYRKLINLHMHERFGKYNIFWKFKETVEDMTFKINFCANK
jgi:hypothetical protein